jgi:hypothetical protein
MTSYALGRSSSTMNVLIIDCIAWLARRRGFDGLLLLKLGILSILFSLFLLFFYILGNQRFCGQYCLRNIFSYN